MNELQHIDMEENDINFINDVYQRLQKKYPVEVVDTLSCDLKTFSVFENDDLTNSKVFLKIYNTDRSYNLAFLDVTYRIESGRHYGTDGEVQLWGVFHFANEYPHILIRPKTFGDKIVRLIKPVDLIFNDDEEFSNKFFVITDDNKKALASLSLAFRNYIAAIESKDIFIEILGKTLVVGNKRKRTPTDVKELLTFLDKLYLSHF